MFLTGVGTAAPSQRYTQVECLQSAVHSPRFRALSPASQKLLRKVLSGDNGIEARHLAVESIAGILGASADCLHQQFSREAPALASEAALRALTRAGIGPADVDGLLISTCTGYLCPGLTSYVGERLGLRPEIHALDLVGQGCGAALPNLRTARAMLMDGACRRVLSICVEVCSAAFYLDDDPGVLVSACLFGDGAGAVVLESQPNPHCRRVEWKGALSFINPELRDSLRFEQRGGMLRNVLKPEVPELASRHAALVLERGLAQWALDRTALSTWILHAGGRSVLLALRRKLGLSEADMRWSAAVLREYGNLSSPFVLFVLEHALNCGAPSGLWWISSFGAGFSCHGGLLQVD